MAQKRSKDGKRLMIVGGIAFVITLGMLIVGQIQMSEADKELREYYGGGFSGESMYNMERATYYLPGEQMRDFGLRLVIPSAIVLVAGYIVGKKKEAPDLLAQQLGTGVGGGPVVVNGDENSDT